MHFVIFTKSVLPEKNLIRHGFVRPLPLWLNSIQIPTTKKRLFILLRFLLIFNQLSVPVIPNHFYTTTPWTHRNLCDALVKEDNFQPILFKENYKE